MKRIKRQVYGKPHTAQISPPPGFTEICREEAEHLLVNSCREPGEYRIKQDRGKLHLGSADYRALLEYTARAVTPSRVELEIESGKAHSGKELKRFLETVPFELYLPPESSVKCGAESTASSLYHEGLITEILEDRLKQDNYIPVRNGNFNIKIDIYHDTAAVCLDLCGQPLWQRGYRSSFTAQAPLREDLAQAALRSGLAADPGKSLYILLPFSGSGTLYFESVIRLMDLPGFFFGRDYAFSHFVCHPEDSYRWMTGKVISDLRQKPAGPVHALLMDTDSGAIEESAENFKSFSAAFDRAGIDPPETPVFKQADAIEEPWEMLIPDTPAAVLLPLNPPFGRRLSAGRERQIYPELGRKISGLARYLAPKGTGLTGFLLCPDERRWREAESEMTGLRTLTTHFSQGGRDMRLLSFSAG
ncbi:MAG: hypothetical protein ACLFST_12890 [Spirochaetia bacterium]